MIADTPDPPKTKYKLTVVINGNSHEELMSEMLSLTRGVYLIMSGHYSRDEFDAHGGKHSMYLEHINPGQDAIKYKAELEEWFLARKKAKEKTADGSD